MTRDEVGGGGDRDLVVSVGETESAKEEIASG
jgi:hypothetical protein